MLPKKRRLTAAQVREVVSLGKSVRGGALSLKYVVKEGYFGAAVVAPKSVARLAVVRNQIRRTVYRALSVSLGSHVSGLQNTRVVFFVRTVPSPLFSTYRKEIVELLTKIPHTHV